MPLLDATRTTVNQPFWDGSFAMAFDEVHFAAFELFILEDETAVERHDESIQVEHCAISFSFCAYHGRSSGVLDVQRSRL